jgi:peptidoglycan/LPS O-acetylase OafA/YrhL
MNSTKKLAELKTNRNIVRAVVLVGIVASIAANTLGAASWINAAIAGWPPVALLLALEILTRVPTSKRWGAAGRILATLGVAGAAGWLSYWHMAATVSQHGEHGGSEYVWPVSVDGLMTIAAIALVELGARIRQLETAAAESAPVSPAAAVVEAFEEITRQAAQAAPISPAVAVAEMRNHPYWGQRIGGSRHKVTKA